MLVCIDLAKRSAATTFYFQAIFEFINDYFSHSLQHLLPKTTETTVKSNSKTLNKKSIGCSNSANGESTSIRNLMKPSYSTFKPTTFQTKISQ